MGLLNRILVPVRQIRGLAGIAVGRVADGISGPVSLLWRNESNGVVAPSSPVEKKIGELATGAPQSVRDVVDRLTAIHELASGSPRGEADGIACFSLLYRTITANVLRWLDEGKFQDSEFLATLDLEFAERYFSALRAYAFDRPSTPACWRVLFDSRGEERISRLHFATVGVNAHINFDLAFSLISTCQRLGVELGADRQHEDYLGVNKIFAANTRDLRDEFESEEDSALVDAMEKFIDDFAIKLTRELAWKDAIRLWPHRLDAIRMAAEQRLVDERAVTLGRAMLENPFLR